MHNYTHKKQIWTNSRYFQHELELIVPTIFIQLYSTKVLFSSYRLCFNFFCWYKFSEKLILKCWWNWLLLWRRCNPRHLIFPCMVWVLIKSKVKSDLLLFKLSRFRPVGKWFYLLQRKKKLRKKLKLKGKYSRKKLIGF